MLFINKLKKYFPLKNINQVLKLIEHLLISKSDNDNDQNIIFASILLGLIEYKLTQTNENEEIENENTFNNDEDYGNIQIFSISFNEIVTLYKSFQSFVNEIGGNNLFKNDRRYLNRAHLKLITDEVFSKLSVAKYKENCHNQSIYSFLTDKSLDSFGLAYTILAVTRHLGYRNVYLALSEDHAWLEYDSEDVNNNDVDNNTQRFTADVAWTGKNEDKRCCSIEMGIVERSRLYLGGNSVVCIDISMIIAAAITTINPVKGSTSLSTNSYSNRNQNVTSYHSLELALLKRDLLWVAYNMDLLQRYPLATINLADLERSYPKFNHDNSKIDYPLVLYREAIEINVKYYNNGHVYPYLSMANYFYHYCNFIRAMKCWRLAANVISKYNYKSEDWIIYREFFEIATHFLPNIFRSIFTKDDDYLSKSSGSLYHNSETGSRKSVESKDVFKMNADQRAFICEELKGSADFLSEFLCFFDFICLWEEGSSVPVLHEVWANKFKEVLIRFNEDTRVSLNTIGVDAGILNNDRPIDQLLSLPSAVSQNIIGKINNNNTKELSHNLQRKSISPKSKKVTIKKSPLSNEEVKQVKDFWKALANEDINLLSSILSSKVLNIDFLVNANPLKMYDFGSHIETIDYENLNCENLCQLKLEQGFIDYFSAIKSVKNILSIKSDNIKEISRLAVSTDEVLSSDQELSNDKENRLSQISKNEGNFKEKVDKLEDLISEKIPLSKVFKSQKMKEICPLIVAPGRLNIPAIKLPLTAQSQVSLKRTGLQSVYGSHSHEYSSTFSRKRLKRE